MSIEDEDFPSDADPYKRPSDLPPLEDDPEPSDLGALAAGSRPSSPKGLKAVAAAHHDDARLDIGALARASARAPEPEPEHVARPSSPPRTALATAAEPEAEWSPRRGAFPTWSAPLAVGFALGLVAGALLFRNATPPTPPPAASSAPVPTIAPVAAAPEVLPVPASAVAPTIAPPEPTGPTIIAEPGSPVAAEPSAPRERAEREYAAAEPSQRPSFAAGEPAPGRDSALTVTPSQEPDTARPAPAAPAAPAEEPKPTRNVDALLDEALSETARQNELKLERQAAETQAGLPLTPSREQVEAAVAVLRPAIRGCAMGQSGLATADIVVRPNGTVAGVHVTGAPFAGAASGRCMEGVVRHAQFPKFRKPSFQIRYPFAIQ